MALWEIQLLGDLRLRYDGRDITTVNTNRLQALFAHLALNAGTLQSRRHLAFLFWPDSTESQARTNLRQLLHHLKSALPDGGKFLEAAGQSLRWQPSSEYTLDVTEFEAFASLALEAAQKGDLAGARNRLEKAVRLYGGDLLPSLYDEWAETKRNQLRSTYSEVLEHLTSLLEQTNELPLAIQYAERLLSQDPLRETSYQTLMRLYALKGDRAGALRVYHQCVTVLQRELATEPGVATRKLREKLMQLDVTRTAAPQTTEKPFATFQPLIGRQKDFKRLLDAWEEAAQGRASFTVVTGEPGIGKTRLLEEFIAWASRKGVSTGYSKCYVAEGHLAYAPVAAWLRSPAMHPVLSGLSGPHLLELARVLPELLLEHPNLGNPQPLSESWQRHHFFEALARAVLRAPQPLLLFIDDMHWCDQETMDWLHYLLRLEPQAQLLLVATVRPGDLTKSHPMVPLLREMNLAGRSMEIALEPLSWDETESLAAQVSGRKLDAMLIAELYKETKGNPLFVIETVRVGMDVSNTRASNSRQEQVGMLEGSRPLPPRVLAVLSARLSQLSPKAQELAGLAATIYRGFTIELLAKASRCKEDALVPLIDELWQRQIIRPQGNDSYDFSHDKLREAAYAELGPARRRLNHRLVAEAMTSLEEMNSDGASAELARHYELASLPALAISHYLHAAKVSQRIYAETDAISHLTRALKLLGTLTKSPERDHRELDMLVLLGPSLIATQGYAASEVGRVYARARMLCESTTEGDQYLSVLWGSFLFHIVRGHLKIAKEAAARMRELALKQSKSTLAAGGHFALGCSLFHLGEFGQARQRFEEAKTTHDSTGGPMHLTALGPELGVFSMSYLAHVLWMFGDPVRSLEYSQSAMAHAEQLAHPFSVALALAYGAMLHHFREETEAAAEQAEKAAVLCREYGFNYYLAWAQIIQGWALARKDDSEKGVALMRKGLAALKDQEAGLRVPYYLTLLGQTCAQAGNLDEGLSCLSEALRLREQSGESWADPEIHRIRGSLLLEKGDFQNAELNFQHAISVARKREARAFELRSVLSLSKLWTRQGKPSQAAALLQKTLTKFGKDSDCSNLKEARDLVRKLSLHSTRK